MSTALFSNWILEALSQYKQYQSCLHGMRLITSQICSVADPHSRARAQGTPTQLAVPWFLIPSSTHCTLSAGEQAGVPSWLIILALYLTRQLTLLGQYTAYTLIHGPPADACNALAIGQRVRTVNKAEKQTLGNFSWDLELNGKGSLEQGGKEKVENIINPAFLFQHCRQCHRACLLDLAPWSYLSIAMIYCVRLASVLSHPFKFQ